MRKLRRGDYLECFIITNVNNTLNKNMRALKIALAADVRAIRFCRNFLEVRISKMI